MITLKNEKLTVTINPYGAELHSIKANDTAREYLWQGEPSVWNGRAPLLFPIAGRLKKDSYIHHYKIYSLPKHGFARRSAFDVVATDTAKAVFSLTDNPKTLASYPFHFELNAEYALSDQTLTVTNRVRNTGNDTMYFSLGAHPAFNIKVGDAVVFEEKEDFTTALFDSFGLMDGEKTLAKDTDTIVIDAHIFDNDAIFFENLKSQSAKIVAQNGEEVLKMTYGKVPYLGLWAKPGAPYVCIEPWHGIADTPNVSGELEEKPYIVSLEPNHEFVFTYTIEILN